MIINPQRGTKLGVVVEEFDAAAATDDDIALVKKTIYREKIVLLKNQHLTPQQFVTLGRRFGEVVPYYEPMYHHPEFPEIFVSSNVPENGKVVGVPRTGKFWHADYAFMPRPFAITLISPQVVPERNRGTYFVNMVEAYQRLSPQLAEAVQGTRAWHSLQRYFKIRPSDVYRPISEIIAEIDRDIPQVSQPTTFVHPVTRETVLYVTEGFTVAIEGPDGTRLGNGLLDDLLTAAGQRDDTFSHELIHLQTFEKGDLLLWDNRSLVHRALHTTKPEPTVSHRVTVYDEYPLYVEDAR